MSQRTLLTQAFSAVHVPTIYSVCHGCICVCDGFSCTRFPNKSILCLDKKEPIYEVAEFILANTKRHLTWNNYKGDLCPLFFMQSLFVPLAWGIIATHRDKLHQQCIQYRRKPTRTKNISSIVGGFTSFITTGVLVNIILPFIRCRHGATLFIYIYYILNTRCYEKKVRI